MLVSGNPMHWAPRQRLPNRYSRERALSGCIGDRWPLLRVSSLISGCSATGHSPELDGRPPPPRRSRSARSPDQIGAGGAPGGAYVPRSARGRSCVATACAPSCAAVRAAAQSRKRPAPSDPTGGAFLWRGNSRAPGGPALGAACAPRRHHIAPPRRFLDRSKIILGNDPGDERQERDPNHIERPVQ
jgi:hypothetical protein